MSVCPNEVFKPKTGEVIRHPDVVSPDSQGEPAPLRSARVKGAGSFVILGWKLPGLARIIECDEAIHVVGHQSHHESSGSKASEPPERAVSDGLPHVGVVGFGKRQHLLDGNSSIAITLGDAEEGAHAVAAAHAPGKARKADDVIMLGRWEG